MSDDVRHDFINGLRDLADFYSDHPDFPLPHCSEYSGSPFMIYGNEDAETFAARVSELGGNRSKIHDDHAVRVVRSFGGGIEVELYASRSNVCERVVVGKETVEVVDPAAPKVMVERDVVEWKCHPVLDAALAPAPNLFDELRRGYPIEDDRELEPF